MAKEREPESPRGNKPEKVIRLRGVSASVFANRAETDHGEVIFHKVAVQRTYKEGEEFKTTTSFGRDDVPVLREVLRQAWVFILETEAKGRKAPVESQGDIPY
jgi:hypothetical protein